MSTEQAAIGDAYELGIPVKYDVNPSMVIIYEDGTHKGKVSRTHTDDTQKCLTDNVNYPVVHEYCPCGHYLRTHHLHHHKDRRVVKCDVPLDLD